MQIQPVDLTAVIGMLSASALLGLPMLGLTLRFAIKPLLDSYARAFPSALRSQAEFERLERRVRELEQSQAMQSLPLPSSDRMMAARSELPRT